MSASEWFIHVWNPWKKAWEPYLDPSTLTAGVAYGRSSDAFELAALLGTMHPGAQYRVATHPAVLVPVDPPESRRYIGGNDGGVSYDGGPSAPLWDEGQLW